MECGVLEAEQRTDAQTRPGWLWIQFLYASLKKLTEPRAAVAMSWTVRML
jgi:hypothetical protein